MNERKTPSRTPSRRDARRDERRGTRRKPKKSGRSYVGYVLSGIMFLLILAVFIFAVHIVLLYLHARAGILNTDEKKGREEFTATVVIEEGSDLKTISESLHEAGIIESPFFFRMKCGLEDADTLISYGTYELSNYMDFDELIDVLSSPSDNDYISFTVIEGQSIYEIAENLEAVGVCSQEEFFDVCDNGEFDYAFLEEIPERENRLEGYLFPDTYFLYDGYTAWDVVNMMLGNFNKKIVEGLKFDISSSEYPFDDIVIIASIIEKEVRYPEERPVVASVIYNRLKQGMKLQMDATVLYAKQEHSSRVYESDTQIESDYNTYQVYGLPKGPIGNAGLASFEGALNPEKTNYIYYVLENTQTGQHFFTDNYDEFLEAKQKYISGF